MALLEVLNDLLFSPSKGNIYVLAFLYVSYALDTIYHTILVHHLNTDFGFTHNVSQ